MSLDLRWERPGGRASQAPAGRPRFGCRKFPLLALDATHEAVLLLPLGCTQALAKSPPNRAAVVMMLGEAEAHVCMGPGEVRPGDRVLLLENDCRPPTPESKVITASCRRRTTGAPTVTRVLNEHDSVIEADPGRTLRAGTIVEEQR